MSLFLIKIVNAKDYIFEGYGVYLSTKRYLTTLNLICLYNLKALCGMIV